MIIELRLNNPYVSELDRLLKERQKQYPARRDTSPGPVSPLLRKLPPESIPFTLKKVLPPETPPKSSH